MQISLKGNTMVHTQTGEKTATREDLTTEVTRTFDTEVGHSAVQHSGLTGCLLTDHAVLAGYELHGEDHHARQPGLLLQDIQADR